MIAEARQGLGECDKVKGEEGQTPSSMFWDAETVRLISITAFPLSLRLGSLHGLKEGDEGGSNGSSKLPWGLD